MEGRVATANAIARATVLTEIVTDDQVGLTQYACLWVHEVYRGDIAAGDVVTVVWPAPFPFEPTDYFDEHIGYAPGEEYVVLLYDVEYERVVVSVDYRTWLLDVFPLAVAGRGPRLRSTRSTDYSPWFKPPKMFRRSFQKS